MRSPFIGCAVALMVTGAAWAGPKEEATAALQGQMDAWNRGDLEDALAAYRPGPDMIWINRTGLDRGLDAFADDLRRQYGADPGAMGVYSGEVLHTEELGPETVVLIVRWKIEKDGRRLFGGISTQIWRPVQGRWRIVIEHAS